MPSVGTLSLQVESNAGNAATSLGELAGALERIKKAVPGNGYGLSGIAKEVTDFVNAVNTIQSASTAFKSIESLGNGLVGIVKVVKYSTDSIVQAATGTSKAVSSINTQPIVDAINAIKGAIGDGIKVGQSGTQLMKIRDVLSTGFNTENADAVADTMRKIASASQELGSAKTATVVNKVADAIRNYASAIGQVQGGGAHDYLQQQIFASVEGSRNAGENAGLGLKEGLDSTRDLIELTADSLAEAIIRKIEERLEEHSPSRAMRKRGVYAGQGLAEGLYDSKGNVQDAAIALADAIAGGIKGAGASDYLPGVIRDMANDMTYYRDAIDATLPKVNALSSAEMIAAGNARLAAMTKRELYAVMKSAEESISGTDSSTGTVAGLEKVNDTIQRASASASTLKIELVEIRDTITSIPVDPFENLYRSFARFADEFNMFQNEARRRLGSGNMLFLGAGDDGLGDPWGEMTAEKMLSTWVDTGEQFRTNWVDWTSDVAKEWRDSWSPNWIMGEGSVSEAVGEATQISDAGEKIESSFNASREAIASTLKEFEHLEKNGMFRSYMYGPRNDITVSDTAGSSTRNAVHEAEEYAKQFEKVLEAKKQEYEYTSNIAKLQEAHFYGNDKRYMGLGDTQGETEKQAALEKTNDALNEHKSLLDSAIEAQDRLNETGKKLTGSWNSLKKGIERMFPTLTSLLKRFGNIVKYRMLRAVLRHITSGFTEGVKNVYQYSKAVGTDLAPAMDSAATSLQQMKNSIGAAAAPVIQALIPVLQSVVGWFINLINYANQFFALLNGQKTWTRALPEQAEAYEKTAKAAKGAGKEMKDLLADWDELNIIQSQSGGSGSGAAKTAEEYSEMFEEVDEFSQSVKDVVDYINEHLGGIPGLLKRAAAILIGWKLSKAFMNGIDILKSLSVLGGITLSIIGIELSRETGYDIGYNGLTTTNLAKAIGGIAATALGGALIGWSVGGPGGAVIGFVLGAAVSAVVLSINIQKGHLDSLYGNVHKDIEDIRKELMEANLFTTEADLQIEVYRAHVQDIEDAEGKVSAALNDLNKTYPVGVEINPGNAQDFKTKINTLVTETNNLISASKETMQELYVPATPLFTENFVDEAWSSVSGYVTQLGTLIGKELSKEITDNTNLEELKQDLVKISTAVLTARKSSEFAGHVGVLGAALREETSMGKYDRETVSNYIKEFNSYAQEKFGEATGQAELEYQELNRMVAALSESVDAEYEARLKGKGRISDEEFEKLKNDLLIAQQELWAWDDGKRVTERAREIFEEWTSAGYELYKTDILDWLSNVMNQNHNQGLRNTALNYATYGSGKAEDEWVEQYLASNRSWLESVIANETGMSEEDIKSLINNTGINPLSFFDESFVKEYRDKIVAWLGKSELTDSQVSRVLASIGIDDDEIRKRIKEVQEERAKNSDWENWNNDTMEQVRNSSLFKMFAYQPPEGEITGLDELKNEDGRPWWDFLGLTYLPPEGAVELENPLPVEAEVDLILDDDQVRKDLEDKIRNAMEKYGEVTDAQRTALELTYGDELYQEVLNELNGRDSGFVPTPARLSAGMRTYSDVGWAPYNPNGGNKTEVEVVNQETDEQKRANISQGTSSLLEALNSILRVAEAINRKEFVVNVNPSTGLAQTVEKSDYRLERVRG